MSYINIDDLKLFPASRIGITRKDARLITEDKYTNIIKQILQTGNVPGFVISQEYKSDEPFKFNIAGYYFEIAAGKVPVPEGNDKSLYATIELETARRDNADFVELVGGIDNDKYTGLGFSDYAVTGSGKYCLQLLDAQGNIPESSKLQLLTSVSVIDCGTI